MTLLLTALALGLAGLDPAGVLGPRARPEADGPRAEAAFGQGHRSDRPRRRRPPVRPLRGRRPDLRRADGDRRKGGGLLVGGGRPLGVGDRQPGPPRPGPGRDGGRQAQGGRDLVSVLMEQSTTRDRPPGHGRRAPRRGVLPAGRRVVVRHRRTAGTELTGATLGILASAPDRLVAFAGLSRSSGELPGIHLLGTWVNKPPANVVLPSRWHHVHG